MNLRRFEVQGYRSLRRLFLEPTSLVAIVGPNGSGKTNILRALRLLNAAARGTLARSLAEEGGISAALWGGARDKGPTRLGVAVELDGFRYSLELGVRGGGNDERDPFPLDPKVVEEDVRFHHRGRKRSLLSRRAGTVTAVDSTGAAQTFPNILGASETALAGLREPERFPEIAALRRTLASWRFFHAIRTDREAPARQPQVCVQTDLIDDDGRDLAAALATIRYIGDGETLDRVVSQAFPGHRLVVEPVGNRLQLLMEVPGLRRAISVEEFSDGTLQFLFLVAALLSPRPPSVMVFNEPETSINPGLLPPLAELLVSVSTRTQIWMTTHSPVLTAAISKARRSTVVELERVNGETRVVGQGLLGRAREDDDEPD